MKKITFVSLIMSSILFGANQSNIQTIETNKVPTCNRIIILEKAVAKLIQENKKINIKIRNLQEQINKKNKLNKLVVSPITESKPDNFNNEVKKIVNKKQKLTKNTCVIKKVPIIKREAEYVPFKKPHIFYANMNILGFKYPIYNKKILTRLKVGEKIEADMWTYAGWIHDKNRKVWLRGFQLSPKFMGKKIPKKIKEKYMRHIRYKLVKECNNESNTTK